MELRMKGEKEKYSDTSLRRSFLSHIHITYGNRPIWGPACSWECEIKCRKSHSILRIRSSHGNLTDQIYCSKIEWTQPAILLNFWRMNAINSTGVCFKRCDILKFSKKPNFWVALPRYVEHMLTAYTLMKRKMMVANPLFLSSWQMFCKINNPVAQCSTRVSTPVRHSYKTVFDHYWVDCFKRLISSIHINQLSSCLWEKRQLHRQKEKKILQSKLSFAGRPHEPILL